MTYGVVCAPGHFDVGRGQGHRRPGSALHREPDRHEALRQRLVVDGTKHVCALLTCAFERGELAVDLLSVVIPAMVQFAKTYRTPGTSGKDFLPKLSPTSSYQHCVTNPT